MSSNATPAIGNRATCRMCGKPIHFVGPYWMHVGVLQPRHPAIPAGDPTPMPPMQTETTEQVDWQALWEQERAEVERLRNVLRVLVRSAAGQYWNEHEQHVGCVYCNAKASDQRAFLHDDWCIVLQGRAALAQPGQEGETP